MEISIGNENKNFLSGREALEWLSNNGEFVFHGSNFKLDRLEPRQQTQYNYDTQKSEPHGKPAVCTTPNYEIAIFRSLINSHIARSLGISHSSSFGYDKQNKPFFKATHSSLEHARRSESLGYVYVFNKKDFDEFSKFEYRAYKETVPVYTIEIRSSDLPKNIEVVESPK